MKERNIPSHEFLTPPEVAQRWRVSIRTLEGWRFKGIGPTFVRIGSRVLYRAAQIEAFENQNSSLDYGL